MKSLSDILLEYMRKKDQERRLQQPQGEPGDWDREMPRELYWDEMHTAASKPYLAKRKLGVKRGPDNLRR